MARFVARGVDVRCGDTIHRATSIFAMTASPGQSIAWSVVVHQRPSTSSNAKVVRSPACSINSGSDTSRAASRRSCVGVTSSAAPIFATPSQAGTARSPSAAPRDRNDRRRRRVAPSIIGVVVFAGALVGCTQASSVPPGGGGAGWMHDIPASIAGDCSADVTAQMQNWIDSLPNGSTARLRSGACYDSESDTLLIHDKADFTLEGNGATIHRFHQPSAGGLRQVQFLNSTNVAVRHLSIVGPNSQHLGSSLADTARVKPVLASRSVAQSLTTCT